MSDHPITAANFAQAALIPLFSRPSPAGRPDSVTFNGANPTVTYYFALRTVDEAGNWSGISNVYVRPSLYSLATSMIGDPMVGAALDFANPWPNPARASASVAYTLPRSGAVNVEVFDIAGRIVRSLVHGMAGPGRTVLPWNLTDDRGRRLDAGIYLIRANLIGETFTRRRRA
jgi:hypothetical protein